VVARNKDEAERIARGEDVTQLREEPSDAEAAAIEAEKFFEPEAAESRGIHEGEQTPESPAAAEAT
jgi:hypothetical protein